ncbi:unnamed protein product [Linum tenue]|uniref:Uncharacterized protein n=2 Tax=Linum tenue TaxID=586396 RepID=A0AAV0H533_9ROSI|nr:unnamed protein product [Linum tenue]
MLWGGDDWSSSPVSDEFFANARQHVGKMRENRGGGLFPGDEVEEGEENLLLGQEKQKVQGEATEVKIKISKKQLTELLGNVDLKGLSVQQVLARLVAVSDEFEAHDQRSWRPNLQSIPE